MGIFKFLSGKSPGEIEEKGDEFLEIGEWGSAKLEYEKALDKLEKTPDGNQGHILRLREKLIRSMEALAGQNKEIAENLIESGRLEEAKDMLQLALELTKEEALVADIETALGEIRHHFSEGAKRDLLKYPVDDQEEDEPDEPAEEEEYFIALCNGLSEEEQAAYYGYGNAFRRGYVALNQGDFELAANELSKAMEENPEDGSYILFELASAHLNLGHQDEAYDLLEDFFEAHPDDLKAHAIMCEILWERKAFDEALERLDSCPREGVDPVAHVLLWGETLLQAERYQEAENLFLGFIQTHGWEENVARSLARAYEATGSNEKARDLYLEIMQGCQGCGRRIDPMIKRRFADISFQSGEHAVEILELYLSLAQEDPVNRKDYYQKISRIYTSMGNENEARRFSAFAEESEG
jgi:tetratricopeptide (TPR) repeat protein